MFRKPIASLVLATFLFSAAGPVPKAHAEELLGLPEPGTMVSLSPAYQPALIKGLTVHKDNPFLFDFIIDVGQDKLQGEALKAEGRKLIKYFLASLAIPEKDLWVNLSPYEKDRTVPEALGRTDMGRDLLAQDYILKQLTASLIYPEKELGKAFWDRIYTKAREVYGTANVPVNTFNKVWIVADKAEVFERNNTAFVTGSHLKVMLEEDYTALAKHHQRPTLQSQIVRDIILPEIEKEVNTGRNFAGLRQVFHSLILAGWYKNNLKQALLNEVYADKEKVKGIGLENPDIKEQIYGRYLQAYKKGVFNFIKEDAQGQTAPRKYFSGGVDAAMAARPRVHQDAAALAAAAGDLNAVTFNVMLSTDQGGPDAAMTARAELNQFVRLEGSVLTAQIQKMSRKELDKWRTKLAGRKGGLERRAARVEGATKEAAEAEAGRTENTLKRVRQEIASRDEFRRFLSMPVERQNMFLGDLPVEDLHAMRALGQRGLYPFQKGYFTTGQDGLDVQFAKECFDRLKEMDNLKTLPASADVTQMRRKIKRLEARMASVKAVDLGRTLVQARRALYRVLPDEDVRKAATILVAEDSDRRRAMIVEYLRGLGYTVYQKNSGRGAWAFLRARPGTTDVVVSDLEMTKDWEDEERPDDGDKLVAKIGEARLNIPVILQTGANEEIRTRMKTLFHDVIYKDTLFDEDQWRVPGAALLDAAILDALRNFTPKDSAMMARTRALLTAAAWAVALGTGGGLLANLPQDPEVRVEAPFADIKKEWSFRNSAFFAYVEFHGMRRLTPAVISERYGISDLDVFYYGPRDGLYEQNLKGWIALRKNQDIPPGKMVKFFSTDPGLKRFLRAMRLDSAMAADASSPQQRVIDNLLSIEAGNLLGRLFAESGGILSIQKQYLEQAIGGAKARQDEEQLGVLQGLLAQVEQAQNLQKILHPLLGKSTHEAFMYLFGLEQGAMEALPDQIVLVRQGISHPSNADIALARIHTAVELKQLPAFVALPEDQKAIAWAGMDRTERERLAHELDWKMARLEEMRADWPQKNIQELDTKINMLDSAIKWIKAQDAAMTADTKGGIDLNAENLTWAIRKDGQGVQMNVDPVLIERIKREGVEGLTPIVLRVAPTVNIWALVGLPTPAK